MKNSGIEWIGEVPNSWEIRRTKYVATSIFKGYGITKEDIVTDGDTPCVRYGEIYTKYNISFEDCKTRTNKSNIAILQYFHFGDILFAGTGELVDEIGKNIVYLGKEKCLAGGDIIVLRHKQNPIFLNYALYATCSQIQKSRGKAKLKVVHISATEIGNIYIALPSIVEQRQIAAHLDKKCAAIDSMVANQQAQIEKLKEYKQSVITEAVTKGLDPSVPMKPSGVEWIGEVPNSWQIIRGKNILTLLNKHVLPTDNVITCFRDGEVTLRSNRREEGFTFSEKEIGYQGVDVGDLIVHGMDGFAGAIGISDSRGKASPVLIVLNSTQNKHYLMFYLRSIAYRNIFLALSTGIRVRSCDLRWNKLSVLPFLVPSLKEQDEIVAYIDHKLREIDKLISVKQQKIEKLNEYKKSLIYEYVTGKKEVG